MSINIFSVLGGQPNDLNSLIPSRDPGAATGSEFIQANNNLVGAAREQNILDEFMHGNIPEFLRDFAEVKIEDGVNTVIYYVMPDYLAIGSDTNYVRMPMSPLTAQKIADKYDCCLPTRKMVNDIWKNAENKLTPKPIPPDAKMSSTPRYAQHNELIREQLVPLNDKALTAGHKKDVVLTNRLSPNNPNKRVAIYGWFYSNGKPIQDLNPSDHDQYYADYSHGIRMVANDVIVNGQPMRINDVFTNPTLSKLVSDEGPLLFQRY